MQLQGLAWHAGVEEDTALLLYGCFRDSGCYITLGLFGEMDAALFQLGLLQIAGVGIAQLLLSHQRGYVCNTLNGKGAWVGGEKSLTIPSLCSVAVRRR